MLSLANPVTRQDYRFFHRLRVRWAEVDMQKIVFNAHYLMYFDTAIAAYWRGLAAPYELALHSLGGDLYVKKASIEFFASARYDDQIDVGLRCARVGNSSIVFEGGIFRGAQLLVTGDLLYVFADPHTQTSRPVPQPLRDLYSSYESGAEMTRLVRGDWSAAGECARALRQRVFVEEQGVPADKVWDDLDATAFHVAVVNRLEQTVAAGRLVVEAGGKDGADGVGRVGRMAVDRSLRGCQWGRQALLALIDHARERGLRRLVLSAQLNAQSFYAREGFLPEGDVFEEAGIAHQIMTLDLKAV